MMYPLAEVVPAGPKKDGIMSTDCLHAFRRPWHNLTLPRARAEAAALRFYDPRRADASIARVLGGAAGDVIAALWTKDPFRPAEQTARPLRSART